MEKIRVIDGYIDLIVIIVVKEMDNQDINSHMSYDVHKIQSAF